ncbi:acetoin reductase family protein [Armillaria luteobubalina]|uniref:Acetoin reductase family protein n=1 Tax=Armillaria luteobubalina TaxID=153913 RepID=A0AA39QBG4_9AGAR|nr:acetoin reductase family protein [Armillaria luteobubalina]
MSPAPRTAIITGAAEGVGRAIALRLSTDGCQVVVSDLPSRKSLLDDLVSEITRTGRGAVAVTADISVERDVEDLVAETVLHFGSIDIMVANDDHVVTPTAPTILDTSVEEWGRVFDPSIKSTLLCYKSAARAMIKQNRGGRIIGTCSSVGKSNCGTNKIAIRGLTQIAACEWRKYGITVNGYAPGMTDTPLLQRMDARVSDLLNVGPGAYVEMMKSQMALERVAQPEEVAHAVSFLASEEAALITGQTHTLDTPFQMLAIMIR